MGSLNSKTLSADFGRVDPTFLNHQAWEMRWRDRKKSVGMAQAVLDFSRNAGGLRAVGARRRNGLALRTLAWQAAWRGDFDEGEALAHRAIARLKDAGADHALATSYLVLCEIHAVRGFREHARDDLDSASEILSSVPDSDEQTELLTMVSTLHRLSGRLDLAQEAILRAKKHAVGPAKALVQMILARSLLEIGAPADALEQSASALEYCDRYDNCVIRPYALTASAAAMMELHSRGEAEDMLREALRVSRIEQDRRADCQILHEFSRLFCMHGRTPEALVLAQGGGNLAGAMGYSLWQLKFLKHTARFQERLGQTEDALASLKKFISLQNRQIN